MCFVCSRLMLYFVFVLFFFPAFTTFFLVYVMFICDYVPISDSRQTAFTLRTQCLPKGEQYYGGNSKTVTKRKKESYILCKVSKKLMNLSW